MASFYPRHHSWEEDIESCNYVFDIERVIGYSLSNNALERDRCLWLARELSKETCGFDTLRVATLAGHEQSEIFANPLVDFNLGQRASYVVSKSILSSKTHSELNRQLQHNLSVHQALLHEAEGLLVKEIVQRAQERQKIVNRKTPNQGVSNRLKNLFLSVRVKVKDFQLNRKFEDYLGQKHFQKVYFQYKNNADRITTPYAGWYNYWIPDLDFNVVKRQLIPPQEAPKHLTAAKVLATYGLNHKRILN